MGTNAQRTRGPAAVALALVLLLVMCGCGSRHTLGEREGVFVSTSLPLASYVKAGSRAGTDEGGKFFFPQLKIYNDSGFLIYSSHEAIENAQILKDLPNRLQNLQPRQEAVHLAEALEAVPEFRARKGEIVGHHRVSVLSVFLENCQACTTQEDALNDVEHRLLGSGINLLVIRVAHP